MTLPAAEPAVGLRCSACGESVGAEGLPEIRQPKHLARILRWKHGKAKGSWVCPECQKFMPAQPE
jgi:hypothetical protein